MNVVKAIRIFIVVILVMATSCIHKRNLLLTRNLDHETFKISVIENNKKYELLRFDGTNLVVNKFKHSGDNKYLPVLDDNGDTMTIDVSDPSFESNFFNILHHLDKVVFNSDCLRNVAISMAYLESNKKSVVYGRFFDDTERVESDVYVDSKAFDIDLKEIVVFMDNYTIVKFSWADGNLTMVDQKVVNPDTDDISKYIYLDDYNSCYSVNINTGRGHALIYMNSDKAVIDGRKTKLPFKPVLYNNCVAYSEYCFMKLINGVFNFQDGRKCARLVEGGIGSYARLVTLEHKENDSYALVDSIKVPLDFTPYPEGNQTMIPLRQYCEIFKARYHYRSLDDSILIERYFHWF